MLQLSVRVLLASSVFAMTACNDSESKPAARAPAIDEGGYCGEMLVSFEPAEDPVTHEVNGFAGALVRHQSAPTLTNFHPRSIATRSQEEASNQVLTGNDRFYTLHGGVRSADEVDVAYAPVFEHIWTAEPRLFLPEGQIFGDGALYAASAYFFPDSSVDFSLVSLDMETGARRWKVVPGQTGQTGATLILSDPQSEENIVYGGGARAVFALEESGDIRWCRNTGMDVNPDPFANEELIHLFGINYHVRTDSVVAIYATGDLIAFDREDGHIIARTRMPGAPSVSGEPLDVPQPLYDGAERAFRNAFVPAGYPVPEGYSFLDTLSEAILGGGIRVANFYAMDPDSDMLWVASTMEDETDGNPDGLAEFGALYGMRLAKKQNPDEGFSIHCRIPFEGGSASTPAVAPGGERIYTSDAFGKVLAFDRNCNQLWETDLGQQIVGSLAVSSTDGEIYAATGQNVFKLEDRGDEAPVIWSSNVEQAFVAGDALLPLISALGAALQGSGFPLPASPRANNLNITGIAENGVMVQTGFGLQASATNSLAFLPIVMSMTLLDRGTGQVINAAAAQEETVAVISSAQDGSLYIGNSPIRRAFLRGLVEPGEGGVIPAPLDPVTSALIPALIGGVTKYGPKGGFKYLVRDASCFAQRRLAVWLENAASAATSFRLSAEYAAALNLIRQAGDNLALGLGAGEIQALQHQQILNLLVTAAESVENENPGEAVGSLADACSLSGGFN